MSIDLTPGSPEWCRRVSPSKVAAIIGVSPWDSQYAMWHKMRGDAPWDEENAAMERGTLCEPAVLAWWRKHHDHTEWREQHTLTFEDWCVATPDGLCVNPDGELENVEAKTTGSNMDAWGEPETDAIPLYYLTQVYTAMHVCHLNGLPVVRTQVPVLGGYRNLFTNYVVEYSAEHGADLLARCKAFYDSLTHDTPPPLDNSVATFEVLKAMHPDIDRDLTAECSTEEAVEFIEATAELTAAKDRDRAARSAVLDRMGRARYLTANGVRVARRQPGKGGSVSLYQTTTDTTLLTTMEEAS